MQDLIYNQLEEDFAILGEPSQTDLKVSVRMNMNTIICPKQPAAGFQPHSIGRGSCSSLADRSQSQLRLHYGFVTLVFMRAGL